MKEPAKEKIANELREKFTDFLKAKDKAKEMGLHLILLDDFAEWNLLITDDVRY